MPQKFFPLLRNVAVFKEDHKMMLIKYKTLFPEVAASLLIKYVVPQAGPICNQYSLPVNGTLGEGGRFINRGGGYIYSC